MKRFSLLVFTVVAFTQAAALEKNCYELSSDPEYFSKTPEVLCVEGDARRYQLTMKTGLFSPQVVAVWNLDLLERARCMDCNQDIFGLSNPSNSVFNELKIRFDGTRKLENGSWSESGVLHVGETKLYYRSSLK